MRPATIRGLIDPWRNPVLLDDSMGKTGVDRGDAGDRVNTFTDESLVGFEAGKGHPQEIIRISCHQVTFQNFVDHADEAVGIPDSIQSNAGSGEFAEYRHR